MVFKKHSGYHRTVIFRLLGALYLNVTAGLFGSQTEQGNAKPHLSGSAGGIKGVGNLYFGEKTF